jgi:hypothetical protein
MTMPMNSSHIQRACPETSGRGIPSPFTLFFGCVERSAFSGAGPGLTSSTISRCGPTSRLRRRQRGPARCWEVGRGSGISTPGTLEFSRKRDPSRIAPDFPGPRGLWQGARGLYAHGQARTAMSLNTFGHLFRVTTWGESHGPAIGCTVDGCPPGVALSEADLQPWLDRRKPGTSKFTTQRQGGGRGAHPVGGVRGADHRHADPADDREHRPAVEGLWRDRAVVPAGPCRHHLSPEIRAAGLSRRRAVLGARNGGAGRGGRRGAGRCWRRWCRG